MNKTKIFKQCSMCKTEWFSRDDFINDCSLHLTGYMANFDDLKLGLLLFTHDISGCHTTISIKANDFLDLYKGVRYTDFKANTNECPQFCIDKTELSPCDINCKCAFVRETIDLIKRAKEKS